MSNEANNPYAAPQADLKPRRSLQQTFVNGAAWSWVMVFLINLPVPLLISTKISDRDSWYGIVAMLALMLVVSSWLVAASPWLAERLIVGGAFLAIAQFVPILHLGAGMIGMSLAQKLGLMPTPTAREAEIGVSFNLNIPAALFLTLFVGMVLLVAAFTIGALLEMKTAHNVPGDAAEASQAP